MFLQPMKKEDIPPMTLMSMWNQVRNAATQGVQGGFAKVGETIQKTPLLKLGVNVLNAADYGLGTVAKTTEGLLTDRVNTLKNLKYQRGEGLKSYANRNVTDISPYVTQKVAGTQIGQKFPMVAPLLGLGAGMLTPSPSDALKVGKFASQAGDVAKFSDEATELVKPSMLDPLASEAKKYKSAEEFVNNQKILYHGTNQDFDKFVKSDLGKSTGAVSAKEGFFFTDNMSEAQNYANVADSKMVANFKKFQKQSEKYAKMVELAENQAQRTGDWDKVTKLQEEWNKFELDATRDAVVKNAKVYETVLDMKNPLTIEINGRPEPGQLTDTIKQAKKQGYDSVIFKNISDNPGVSIRPGGEQFTSNHYVVFSPSQIKTKSQLIDIWKKAQGN
jgi:hypothetical protein